MPPPTLDHHLRLCPGTEPFQAEAFVTEFAVKALADAVLPWLAWIDQRDVDLLCDDPAQQLARHKLRTIVRAEESRCPALAHQSRQHINPPRRADASIDVDRKAFLGELVGHRQTLQLLTIGRSVEHEVVAPHLVHHRRRLWPGPRRRHTPAASLAWHLKLRQPPQAPRPTRAHRIAIARQENPNAPIAVAWILCRQPLHPFDHFSVLRCLPAAIAQCRSCHRE